MISDVDELGFEIVASVFDPTALQSLIAELGPVPRAGRRGILTLPCVAQLARDPNLLAHVRPHLTGEPIAVRGIYFDKSADSNWLVAWHQDTSIAVEAKWDVAGFGLWSTKDGITHVRPPAPILEHMLAVRIHLDDVDESNGALRVIRGSHKFGILSNERIQEFSSTKNANYCIANAGDVMLMRPLLLHASSRSTSPRHRRVLHIEYAGFSLPAGLQWHPAA